MQEEYAMLKQENYQLKNEISELKNAFDLNRDILKIISEESKSSKPRVQMLYQIINRLTSINNQIMINTAQLIHQKNTHKIQKQFLKKQNDMLKQKITDHLQKQFMINKTQKVNQLSIYFNNKINDLENELKVLEQQRIIKEHEIEFLKKKIQHYEGQENKISLIPTIDKNNPGKKYIQPPASTLVQPLQHARKHTTNKQIKQDIKLSILHRQMSQLKIYTEQIQYRLLALIKVLQLQEDVKKKETQSIKKQHRRCLQQSYAAQMAEVRLLKFALNNLVKQEKEGSDLMFALTNRNFEKQKDTKTFDRQKCRRQYLYKSVEKHNKVNMKPQIFSKQSQEHEIKDQQ